MKIESLLTEEAVLTELGGRLARRRIELGLAQAALAEKAGVSKRTVERMEAGATAQTATLIRILRALELLERMETLVPDTGPRPMDLLKLKGKERQRAPRKKPKTSGKPWKWGDEA
ncbi:MAG: helix-turn-helix domain-containing protein [Kiritimatiellae bacterium]|nr:helix-turn-helix domain-containing protein [Kiritimatiellia bacterium]